MITFLYLQNFKCFRSLELRLAALNVFAGINGAGKSTVIQSLLAVRQSLDPSAVTEKQLRLRGDFIDLGTAGEVYCAEPCSEYIEVRLEMSSGAGVNLRSVQSADVSNLYFLALQHELLPQNVGSLSQEPFNYLHAERVGPRKIFPISSRDTHPLCVGMYGENAPYIIASKELRETRVTNTTLLLESSDGKEYPTLQFQWPLWMDRLFPGFDEESEIYSRADQVRLGLALQQQETGQKLYVRPPNTGFGLSFVLGIIVAGLVARPDTTLIVENPEAHLHPAAQSNVGEFLARVASGGTQVFVETHSEHVLNGIRRMIKAQVIGPNDLSLSFFSKAPRTFEPTVTPISVAPSGDFSSWPQGFFDQLDRDLSVILS